jgi:hypothetical protein
MGVDQIGSEFVDERSEFPTHAWVEPRCEEVNLIDVVAEGSSLLDGIAIGLATYRDMPASVIFQGPTELKDVGDAAAGVSVGGDEEDSFARERKKLRSEP